MAALASIRWRATAQAAIEHIIIGMPPTDIIIGMPMPIMPVMRLQHSMNIVMSMPAAGFISQVMPEAVIVQVISHIIMGIMPIIGFIAIIGFMPIIMGFIPIICGIIIGFMPIWGIITGFMPPIGMFIIEGIICIAGFIYQSPGAGNGRRCVGPAMPLTLSHRNLEAMPARRFLRLLGRSMRRAAAVNW